MGFDIDRSDSEDEDAAVAALVLLHRQRQAHATKTTTGSEYQKVVSYFEQRGERLRGERLVTQELVQRLLGANVALTSRQVHRELEVHGPSGGIAAGRLRVRNESSLRQAFELTVGDPVSGSVVPEVRVDPQRGMLAQGESCALRVEARLRGFGPGDCATLPIHCRWDTGLDRIWLVVRADLGEGPHR